jgi:hypothetical protein
MHVYACCLTAWVTIYITVFYKGNTQSFRRNILTFLGSSVGLETFCSIKCAMFRYATAGLYGHEISCCFVTDTLVIAARIFSFIGQRIYLVERVLYHYMGSTAAAATTSYTNANSEILQFRGEL